MPSHRRPGHVLMIVLALCLTAASCARVASSSQPGPEGDITGRSSGEAALVPPPPRVANPNDVYDPVRAGEEVPVGYRQLLARDAILPVYAPTFVTAADVGWDDQNLVIGVDLADEPRAYPVGFLTRREMVVDNHRGIPTLVTW